MNRIITVKCFQVLLFNCEQTNELWLITYKLLVYKFNMYKYDLALNNLQWLICCKTLPINHAYFIYAIILTGLKLESSLNVNSNFVKFWCQVMPVFIQLNKLWYAKPNVFILVVPNRFQTMPYLSISKILTPPPPRWYLILTFSKFYCNSCEGSLKGRWLGL